MSTLNETTVKEVLESQFPEFRKNWESDQNYFRQEDGSYSYHALLAQFTNFFSDNIDKFSEKQLRFFFDMVENWISEEKDPSDTASFSNAVCTCFLENMSSTYLSKKIKPFLGEKSLKFYSYWDPETKK